MNFAEVLLPLPLNAGFTYAIPDHMRGRVKQGHRVIVPFGKKKYYTGIVRSLALEPPEGLAVKEIAALLDESPIVRRPQLQLWDWIAQYYLCSVGEVMRAAMPAGLKVESETFLEASTDVDADVIAALDDREAVVYQLLEHHGKRMSVDEIERATGLARVNALASQMLDKGLVMISEKLVERYRAQRVEYVHLAFERGNSEAYHAAFAAVKGAPKQEKLLLTLIEMTGFTRRDSELQDVTMTALLERTGLSRPLVNALAKKGLVELEKREINRFRYDGSATVALPSLSEAQHRAFKEIDSAWHSKDVVLLRGVTSSGKTEIYMHLLQNVLEMGRQALMLVPEIALTTQLTRRLQRVFGNRVVIYHSKFSDNERVDIWKKLLADPQPCIVVGARSALFLPFANLGLVIVDEEHETSYKQENPAPRYNARDTAMVLARMHGAKALLGSATPAIETYFKALNGKYGLVELTERFGGVPMPEIELINTLRARKSGEMKGLLSKRTRELVQASVDAGKQSILFLNRRGYAPVAECRACAYSPKCSNCDVSLTYHKGINKLVCHYCGAIYELMRVCPACREPAVEVHGFGTERIEQDVETAWPGVAVTRMDLDTTRNKDGYENIINEFSQGKSQILVGTQMVTKGLDFKDVETVAVLNADATINLPDFRASERAFNMLEQVAGRAGRRDNRGVVAIQTRQPDNELFKYVINHDYRGYFDYEIEERKRYNYPPFTRVIYIYLRHREHDAVNGLAIAYARRLRELFGNRAYGPEQPAVGRVQNLYIRKLMLKVETNASMQRVKEILLDLRAEIANSPMAGARSLIVTYDVDPY